MGTDDKCVRAFVELRAFPGGSINDYRNVQFNPLAAPVFQPSICISEALVVQLSSLLGRLPGFQNGLRCVSANFLHFMRQPGHIELCCDSRFYF
jgi:hypothetical protein